MSASNVRVKICGLRDAGSANAAVQAGADALGFILAPSRRQIAPVLARTIRGEIQATCNHVPPMVGVVVNATATDIERDMIEGGFDMIQLSGDEAPCLMDSIDVPVIRAVRLPERIPVEKARREINGWLDRSRPAKWIIVEGHIAGSYGGTGAGADWNLVASLAGEFPLWLAGGLHPGNVSEAITVVKPFGVDVSSGIETDGMKDQSKIKTFVARVQGAVRSGS